MLYQELPSGISKKTFSIVVECMEKSFDEKGGVSVNFYKERPHPPNTKRDILFHFNPRPPNKLILNTCKAGAWQEEVVLIDDEFTKTLFKMPFKLTIEPTDDGKKENKNYEFKVSLNQKPLTWYLCLFDIKEATHLGYSPGLRIQHIHPN